MYALGGFLPHWRISTYNSLSLSFTSLPLSSPLDHFHWHTPALVSPIFKTTITSTTSLGFIFSLSFSHIFLLPFPVKLLRKMIFTLASVLFLLSLSGHLSCLALVHTTLLKLSLWRSSATFILPNTVVNFQSLVYLSAALDRTDNFFPFENFPPGFPGITLSWFSSYLTKYPSSVSCWLHLCLISVCWGAKGLVLRYFLYLFIFLSLI